MKIEWTKEERFRIGNAVCFARAAGDNETAAAAEAGVSVFLDRASGQVADYVRLLRGVLDDEGMGGPDDEPMRALSHLSALAQEAASLRASADELQRQRDSRGEALEVAEEANKTLRAKVEDVEKERDEFGVWVRSYRSEIAALKSARDVLRERALVAESELLRSRQNAESLRERLTQQSDRAKEFLDETERLKDEIHALVAKNGEVERHASDARAERDAAREDLAVARAEMERLRAELEKEAEDSLKVIGEHAERVRSAESRLSSIRDAWKRDPWQPLGTVSSILNDGSPGCPVPDWGDAPKDPGIPDGSPQCPGNTCDGLTCESDAPGAMTPAGALFAEMAGPKRHPCSPTCTHDDAATPGHPERIKKRDLAVKAALLNGDAYERGAEAMRAACSEAVKAALLSYGFHDTGTVAQSVKAAIEGAKP